MKILLDVGANIGEATEAALAYSFDEVHTFEPSRVLNAALEDKFKDEWQVQPHPFGLLHAPCEATLFKSGGCGASIYADKVQHPNYLNGSEIDEPCNFQSAISWVEKYRNDELFVKLNCEGAELPILVTLHKAKLLWAIDYLLVEYDTMKMDRLRDETIDIRGKVLMGCPDVFDCSLTCIPVKDKIERWLDSRIKLR